MNDCWDVSFSPHSGKWSTFRVIAGLELSMDTDPKS
jgi:hypothetical protein